jgi:hypothetical protein
LRDTIINVPYDKNMLICVYEWTFQHVYFHKDMLSQKVEYEISTWDRNYFSYINEHFAINQYNFLLAANYFNIPKLVEILIAHIATQLETRPYHSLMKPLIKFNIVPIELKERIFYDILQNRSLSRKHIHSQMKLRNYHEHCNMQYRFKISDEGFELFFKPSSIKSLTFEFFDSVDESNFINITEKSHFLNLLAYPNISLNMNNERVFTTIRNYMGKYIDHCLIAGGLFTNYTITAVFNPCFNKIFQIFEKNKNVDIYIPDIDSTKYIYYYRNLTETYNLTTFDYTNTHLNCRSFKVILSSAITTLDEDLILNLIFINYLNIEPNRATNIHLLDVIHKFDFTICKIFYSFKLQSTFMHSDLFTPMVNYKKRLNSNYITTDISFYLKDLKQNLHVIQKLTFSQLLSIQQMHTELYVYEVIPELQELFTFVNNGYIRTLKYCFKNCICDCNLIELQQNILSFQEIFSSYVDKILPLTTTEINLQKQDLFTTFKQCLGKN